jgi:hypothetical protein
MSATVALACITPLMNYVLSLGYKLAYQMEIHYAFLNELRELV